MVRRVAQPHAWIVAAAAVLSWTGSAAAQGSDAASGQQIAALSKVPGELSRECKVSCKTFEGPSPLRQVRRALRDKRPIKVLAIGSSSTVGVGASSPVAGYPFRLEADLEAFLKDIDVEMITRGISGEVAHDAADRMKLQIADLRPDLVVWQVGTNDAMARIDAEQFAELLRSTLRWLRSNRIDVVLIDPQYVDHLAADPSYVRIVEAITKVAREQRVLLVHRFDAMAELAKQRGNGAFLASDRFHLNDLGYRCMAEYAARAIVAGLLNNEQDPALQPPQN